MHNIRCAMKVLKVLVLFSILAVPCFGQTSRPSSLNMDAAQKAWPAFITSFRKAIRTRDRERLRTMLAPDLLFTLGHHRTDHLDEAFAYWDANNGRGWKAFDRILNQGTAPLPKWWNNGAVTARPRRVAPAATNRRINIDRERVGWYAIFEFRDGRWYCQIFQECCDYPRNPMCASSGFAMSARFVGRAAHSAAFSGDEV